MSFLKRFHHAESAQISFLAVASVVCFVGLLSMVINTDDIVTERVYMQDVADATALSAAAWTARGLNMISFINVLNSKLISTAVLLNALADTIPAVEAVGNIQQGIATGCCGVPIIGTACCIYAGIVKVQLIALKALRTAVENMAKTLSRCNKALWKTMTALNTAAQGVKETFTVIGIAEGYSIAEDNGADFGFVVNGNMLGQGDSNLLSLPVEPADFSTFCPFVKNGGSGYKMAGYKCDKGPFKLGKDRIMKTILIPFTNLFAHPIFLGMSAAHFGQVGCTADPSENSDIKVTLKSHAECRKFDEEARWSHIWSRTAPIEEGGYTSDDFAPWKPLNEVSSDDDDSDLFEDIPDISSLGDASADASPFTPGRAYQFLEKSTELKLNSPQVDCNGERYPLYRKPIAGFDSDQPGQVECGFGFQECKRIDDWSEFTWYSSSGSKIDPEKRVGGYFMRVGRATIEPENENEVTKYRYIVETVSLVDAGTTEMDQEEFKKYLEENKKGDGKKADPSDSSSCGNKPEPFVLNKGTTAKDEEKFQNKLRFIGVVYRNIEQDQPFWSGYFKEPPKVLAAYAQAQVYNHLAEDTFTQDWRVRLEQASLLEGAVEKISGSVINVGEVNNH